MSLEKVDIKAWIDNRPVAKYQWLDCACDVVLYSEFDSREALQAYDSHHEHRRVKGQLGNSRIGRHQVDYRIS